MKLFIGPLTSSTTDDELKAFFINNNADVTSIKVMRDAYSGKSRRFAYAESDDPMRVVALCNGKIIGSNPVTVKEI